MKKFISSILLLVTVIYTIRLYAGVKLSERGYDIIASKESVQFKQSIKKSESHVTALILDLPYKYNFSQEFIDGMIIVGTQIGQKELSNSVFYERLKKCRVENNKINRLDYKFTIAAIRDLNIALNMDIYDLMAEPVIAHENKVKNKIATTKSYQEVKKFEESLDKNKEVVDNSKTIKNEKVAIKISKEGKEMIKKFEGCSLKAYWDVNGYSIGYGHHSNVKKKDKITKKQADKFFDEDIKFCEAAAARLINALPYEYNFRQGFIDGLCSLIYNCGEAGVKKTRFYKSLKKCRVSDLEMNESDYKYTINFVKRTNISCEAHKTRRVEEYKSMLD